MVFEAGMRHFPEKLGFVFTEGKGFDDDDDDGVDDDGDLVREIPYFEACTKQSKIFLPFIRYS